jgi:hypothetical protein
MKITKEQLAKLSPEEKLRLLDLLEERHRRELNKRESFTPNDGQEPVLMSEKRIRCVFTGNGGGKTAMASQIAMAAFNGWDPWLERNTPVPCRVIVVLDKPDKVGEVWLPELKKWFSFRPDQFHKDGKPYISRITGDNGSYIKFMFHDQEPMSFESIEADLFIFDEPPPRHVFIGLRRGGRTKGRKARFVIIGTPLAAPWLRKEIYEPWSRGEAPDTDCFKFKSDVNKQNLDWEAMEAFFGALSEKERAIRQEGEFFDLDGLALAHLFDRTVHLLPRDHSFDRSKPVVVAVDPHPNKKHVALMVGADEYGLVAVKELSLKLVPRDFAKVLKKWMEGYRVLDIVCDSLGASEMTGGEGFSSFIQVAQSEGVRLRSTTYEDKSDEDWIQRIQDVLAVPQEENNFKQRLPKLRVSQGCTGLISDIETVQWVKVRNLDEYKPKLDIGSKDFLACLKYALACNLTHQRKRERAYYVKKPVYGLSVKPKSITMRAKRYR